MNSSAVKAMPSGVEFSLLLVIYQISQKQQMALILPKRNMASFLSEISDAVPLSSLCLPGKHDPLNLLRRIPFTSILSLGTHDTLALYGWPISQW